MMTQPKISVVIPVYNRAHLIGDTIESVLEQTYDNFEILVVDDGSTDDTDSVVKSYGDSVRYIYQENMGMGGAHARNTGIDAATGDFIAFLDSDDEWLPTKLNLQVQLLDDIKDIAWAYCDAQVFEGGSGQTSYQQSNVYGVHIGDILIKLFLQQFLMTSTIIARREVFDNLGNFWPTPKATDRDMWLRIASSYPIGYVPKSLVRYRLHPDRITDTLRGEESYQASIIVVERAVLRNPERLSPFKNQALAQSNIMSGMLLVRQGDAVKARGYFTQAIKLRPTNLRAYTYLLSTFFGKRIFDLSNNIRRSMRKRYRKRTMR